MNYYCAIHTLDIIRLDSKAIEQHFVNAKKLTWKLFVHGSSAGPVADFSNTVTLTEWLNRKTNKKNTHKQFSNSFHYAILESINSNRLQDPSYGQKFKFTVG